MSAPALELRGVSAGYGAATVLREIDLTVGAGEVVSLLGPNGAGKTTTLLAISGIVPVRSGAISVLGIDPTAMRPHDVARQGVVHVPENRGVLAQLTVRENLTIGLGRGNRTTAALANFPELEPLLDRRAGLLSGGEQQMLALGRALAAQPKVLLLDEMSLGLAPVIVERLMPFARAAAEAGAAVLLVEQHTDVALDVSDRAYVLVHGEVVLSGSSSHLRRERHLLDAAFLGYGEESDS